MEQTSTKSLGPTRSLGSTGILGSTRSLRAQSSRDDGLLFGKGRIQSVRGDCWLDKYLRRLEREVEEEQTQPFGKAFMTLMETLSRPSMKVKSKALSNFLQSIPTKYFSMGFSRFDGGSAWAGVFYQLGKLLKRSLLNSEKEALLVLCRSLANSTTPSSTSLLLSSLIDHLTTHSIDPCNFFIGAHPAELPFRYQVPSEGAPSPHSYLSATASVYLFGSSTDLLATYKEKEQEEFKIDSSEVNFEAVLTRWGQLFSISPRLCEREMTEFMKVVTFDDSYVGSQLVAVPIEHFPASLREEYTSSESKQPGVHNDHIFCRLKRLKSSFAEIWITPMEDSFISVPPDSVLFFDWNLIESTGILPQCGPTGLFAACVGDPCAWIQSGVKSVIASTVKKLLEKEFSIHTNFAEKYSAIESLLPAFQNHQRFLSSFLSANLRMVLSKTTLEEGEKYIEKCLEKLPSAYKESYKSSFLRQMKKIHTNLPTFVEKELQALFQESEKCINRLRKKVSDCANGAKKNDLCSWWLAEIEEQANVYLQKHGVDLTALPGDYMNCAPVSLKKVEDNLEVLTEILETEELKDFVEHLTQRIYVELDEFVHELEFFVGKLWVEAIGTEETTIPDQSLKAVQQDLDYLKKMKKMDDEIYEKRKMEKGKGKKGEEKTRGFQMTDVVPIAGLVMARFSMFECEHRTALELWGKLSTAQINPPPRTSNEFEQRLKRLGLFTHQGLNWHEADLQFYERLRAPLPVPQPLLVEVGEKGGESKGFLEYFLGEEPEEEEGNWEFGISVTSKNA